MRTTDVRGRALDAPRPTPQRARRLSSVPSSVERDRARSSNDPRAAAPLLPRARPQARDPGDRHRSGSCSDRSLEPPLDALAKHFFGSLENRVAGLDGPPDRMRDARDLQLLTIAEVEDRAGVAFDFAQ